MCVFDMLECVVRRINRMGTVPDVSHAVVVVEFDAYCIEMPAWINIQHTSNQTGALLNV